MSSTKLTTPVVTFSPAEKRILKREIKALYNLYYRANTTDWLFELTTLAHDLTIYPAMAAALEIYNNEKDDLYRALLNERAAGHELRAIVDPEHCGLRNPTQMTTLLYEQMYERIAQELEALKAQPCTGAPEADALSDDEKERLTARMARARREETQA